MKTYKLILTACICIFCLSISQAQTKPKTTSTKQTTKGTKTGTKKAPKAINVYVCTSPKDKFFHKYSSCTKLNNCSNEIKNIKSAAELKKYKRKSCPHCFNL